MQLLWREPWLKPLIDYDLDSESCGFCKGKFNGLSFVTSCEFCRIDIMHDRCANSHILKSHMSELETKIMLTNGICAYDRFVLFKSSS